MTLDDEYREKLILVAIDNAEKACQIIIGGIETSLEELHTFRAYLSQLVEAQNNLRSGQYIVSMFEYAKIKTEIGSMYKLLRDKENGFIQIKQYLKDKRKEAEVLREQLRTFRIATRRGVILPFRRDGGKY